MFAWEPSFMLQVGQTREKELAKVKSQAYINAFVGVLAFCTPYLVSTKR